MTSPHFGFERGDQREGVWHPLTICRLSDLPRFSEAVLLDIDVDYFDPPDLGEGSLFPPSGLMNSLPCSQ